MFMLILGATLGILAYAICHVGALCGQDIE